MEDTSIFQGIIEFQAPDGRKIMARAEGHNAYIVSALLPNGIGELCWEQIGIVHCEDATPQSIWWALNKFNV